MTRHPTNRRWGGPPLMLQILALLLGGLVIAQLVTLFLTLLLPPAPSPQHSLAAVAGALRGDDTVENRADRLERVIQSGPPDLSGPGWLVSQRSKTDLANLLGADPSEIRLAFFTPLPFAGTAAAPKLSYMANDGPIPDWTGHQASGSILRLAAAPGGPPPMGGAGPAPFPPMRNIPPPMTSNGGLPNASFPNGQLPPLRNNPPAIQVDSQTHGSTWIPGDSGAAVPPLLQVKPTKPTPPVQSGQPKGGVPLDGIPPANGLQRGQGPLEQIGPGQATPQPGFLEKSIQPSLPSLQEKPALVMPQILAPTREGNGQTNHVQQSPPASPPAQSPPIAPPAAEPAPASVKNDIQAGTSEPGASEPSLPLEPRAGGLFGLAPAPFVEGNFVAAMRLPDGRWSVVQPAPESFPNAWQRRVLLWFLIAFAIVAPIGWLFARRVVRPLSSFADAAERLGRDPAAVVIGLDGPAEVGRAARAFNIMQSRLKSFVEDRTAMIGAISHDLRTPLTRLRFRIEEVDDNGVREGMIAEVEEMEAMITSVLNFIRDASTPGAREQLDLRTIVEDVVEDAVMVGSDVSMLTAEAAPVEVDVLGMRRLFANLLDNAVKYGDRARVRLFIDQNEAIAEVIDDGPGVPAEDLERAFEPFYRAADAQASDKRGSGLGLAVCRSIARAHGGDVTLVRLEQGFCAQLRVPLIYKPERALAA